MADALLANEAKIRAENEADVEMAQMSGTAKSLIGRLTMKPGKVSSEHFTLKNIHKYFEFREASL